MARVEGSAIAPVGATVAQPKGGYLVKKAWVFPYRVGSQTEYLAPDTSTFRICESPLIADLS